MADLLKSAPDGAPAPLFGVEIHSGQRAQPPAAEPVRAAPSTAIGARRARNRRWLGRLTLLGLGLALSGMAVLWWVIQPPAGVLARVNGEYITAGQIDREMLLNRALSALANNGQSVADSRTATLERRISERVLAQAVERSGMSVTDAELDTVIGRLLAAQGWTVAQLDSALARQGLSRSDLRASIRDRVLVSRYMTEVVTRRATDANNARALENTWRAEVENKSRLERYGNPEAADAPQPGRAAPDFTLRDMSGRAVRLQDYRGRPVLINFWATWCAPCRIEMPVLVRAYNQAQASDGANGLVILGVAISSTPDTISAFQKEYGMTFPVLPDTENAVLTQYRIGPIPTSFLVDRAGFVRWVHLGTWTDALLAEKLTLVR